MKVLVQVQLFLEGLRVQNVGEDWDEIFKIQIQLFRCASPDNENIIDIAGEKVRLDILCLYLFVFVL